MRNGGLTVPTTEPITARQVEQILRDAGLPRRFAKAIVAGGFRAAAGGQGGAEVDPDALAQRLRAAIDLIKGPRK